MVKRVFMIAALAVAGFCGTNSADAGIYFRRVAPVRRVAARAILPPYPVARAVIGGPVINPWVGYPGYYSAGYYGSPLIYGPGVGVVVY